jgi:hypothetical protein
MPTIMFQLSLIFGRPINTVLVTLVLLPIILMKIGFYKKKLSFCIMEFPHTAQIIYQSIISVLQEFNLKKDLENNFFSISFDNTSNNIKSIDYFTRSLNPIMDGKMFHQKCAYHILYLTVKASIKTQGVNTLIVKLKNSFHYIFSNNIRKREFHALCARLGLSKLRVQWDVDTRWNSTYRMFHRCFLTSTL